MVARFVALIVAGPPGTSTGPARRLLARYLGIWLEVLLRGGAILSAKPRSTRTPVLRAGGVGKLARDTDHHGWPRDGVGPDLDPQQQAVARFVDAESPIRTLDRRQSCPPLRPGHAAAKPDDDHRSLGSVSASRHSCTNLFTILTALADTAIECCKHRQRQPASVAYANTGSRQVPPDNNFHVILEATTRDALAE